MYYTFKIILTNHVGAQFVLFLIRDDRVLHISM